MSKIFIPKISNILAHRQRKIDDYLVKANDLKEQAAASLQKYQTALEQAKKEANASIDVSKKEMKEYVEKKQNELAEKLNAKLVDGEAQLLASQKKVLNDIKKLSQDLVTEILPKVGAKSVSAHVVEKTVSDILKN